MKIYVVIGYGTDYESDDWYYAYCATRELAEREMAIAIEEEGEEDYNWEVHEYNVVTE